MILNVLIKTTVEAKFTSQEDCDKQKVLRHNLRAKNIHIHVCTDRKKVFSLAPSLQQVMWTDKQKVLRHNLPAKISVHTQVLIEKRCLV